MKEKYKYPGYLIYPSKDDVYSHDINESDIDPEDISKLKSKNESYGSGNEKGFREDMTGGDLDVSGSELDDEMETMGSEDEENNYYSLGGDNHNDLDETDADLTIS